MHGLDIIIHRNAEAAGREAAHALKDGPEGKHAAIEGADEVDRVENYSRNPKAVAAYERGYRRGREER